MARQRVEKNGHEMEKSGNAVAQHGEAKLCIAMAQHGSVIRSNGKVG